MYIIFTLFVVFFIILFLYLKLNPQFGGKAEKKHINVYSKSKNWNKNKFENLEKTTMDFSLKTFPAFLKEQITNTKVRTPEKPLIVEKFDVLKFESKTEKPRFVWFGHSVLLLKIKGKNLLIDPMFGSDASPIGPIRTKRFSENTLEIIDDLPNIDAVLLTHDHYDHLDFDSFNKLKSKVDTYFVGLGNARHIERWGVSKQQITEFDWWQNFTFEGIEITYTPSRHFTGRGLTDRAKALWGGWSFKTDTDSVFWSGDGGYGMHFKEIGEKLGPFDIAFMECGQYNDNWKQIHLHPEQSVQAGIDVQAKIIMPVHWAGFKLALHSWKEPAQRFVNEANDKEIKVITPKIGQIVSLEENFENGLWYEKLN